MRCWPRTIIERCCCDNSNLREAGNCVLLMHSTSFIGEQLLKAEIERKREVMGSTPTGSDWAVKALHPSDPITEVRGIPDQSNIPSVCMNYQSVLTIKPQAGAVTPWSFEATLLPHPINFMVCDIFDSMLPAGHFVACPNLQLPGSSHAERYQLFTTLYQRWRMAYMSVTCYQDGPDLANQGTICVSQPPVAPRRVYGSAPTAEACGVAIEAYSEEDKPSFATSQSMPSAYMGRSREGAYVPMKLTETCQDWRSDADAVYCSVLTPSVTLDKMFFYIPSSNPSQVWPHVDLEPRFNVAGTYLGSVTSPMLSGNMAHISAKNLSVETSFTFYVRFGLEAQVSPNSALAPQLKLSPPYDPVALESYFAVSRELKDAYPANYNDLGKLWDEISAVARKVLPMIPTVGPGSIAVKQGGAAAVAAGDAIRKALKRRKKKARAKLNKTQATAGAKRK